MNRVSLSRANIVAFILSLSIEVVNMIEAFKSV